MLKNINESVLFVKRIILSRYWVSSCGQYTTWWIQTWNTDHRETTVSNVITNLLLLSAVLHGPPKALIFVNNYTRNFISKLKPPKVSTPYLAICSYMLLKICLIFSCVHVYVTSEMYLPCSYTLYGIECQPICNCTVTVANVCVMYPQDVI